MPSYPRRVPSLQSKLPAVGTTIFTTMSQLAAESQAMNLGQGFPDFDPPAELLDALARAARDGHNQYAPMTGLPALREAVAEQVFGAYGRHVDPASDITVTSGATEALFNAIHAVLRPGDEAIVLDPSYDSYDPAITLAGARCVHVPLHGPLHGQDRPDSFAIDFAALAAAFTPRTRLLVINSPHNPTGAALSLADLDQLAALLRDRDCVLLSDEVYEHIVFDGRPHASVLRHEELAARAFVVSSFGKTWHCTGWKVGTCIAPHALSAEFRKVHQYNTFATSSVSQQAFATVLRSLPQHAAALPAFYQARRDRFRAGLARTRLTALPVAGTYFQLVDYSALSDLPDVEFARWLCVTHGVATIPLSSFYGSPPRDQRLVRLCFAKRDTTLDAAIERLASI